MTLVMALPYPDPETSGVRWLLATDSYVGGENTERYSHKVFTLYDEESSPQFVLGMAGYLRELQIVELLELPIRESNYLSEARRDTLLLLRRVREELLANRQPLNRDLTEHLSHMIIIRNGRAFVADDGMFALSEWENDLIAVGAGAEYAKGAYDTILKLNIEPPMDKLDILGYCFKTAVKRTKVRPPLYYYLVRENNDLELIRYEE